MPIQRLVEGERFDVYAWGTENDCQVVDKQRFLENEKGTCRIV